MIIIISITPKDVFRNNFSNLQTDMNDDMKAEVLEMCVNACEKHTTNNENAAKMIKETVTKHFYYFRPYSHETFWPTILR